MWSTKILIFDELSKVVIQIFNFSKIINLHNLNSGPVLNVVKSSLLKTKSFSSIMKILHFALFVWIAYIKLYKKEHYVQMIRK